MFEMMDPLFVAFCFVGAETWCFLGQWVWRGGLISFCVLFCWVMNSILFKFYFDAGSCGLLRETLQSCLTFSLRMSECQVSNSVSQEDNIGLCILFWFWHVCAFVWDFAAFFRTAKSEGCNVFQAEKLSLTSSDAVVIRLGWSTIVFQLRVWLS